MSREERELFLDVMEVGVMSGFIIGMVDSEVISMCRLPQGVHLVCSSLNTSGKVGHTRLIGFFCETCDISVKACAACSPLVSHEDSDDVDDEGGVMHGGMGAPVAGVNKVGEGSQDVSGSADHVDCDCMHDSGNDCPDDGVLGTTRMSWRCSGNDSNRSLSLDNMDIWRK